MDTAEITRGRKFDQVLAGARKVFMANGYEGASVDDISREAQVSKATLYSYFPDKRTLFAEVAGAECRRQAEIATSLIDMSAPVREVLTGAANYTLAFILSDFGISIYRIFVAEAERFPDLARNFYESGPQQVLNVMTDYLSQAISRGELDIPPGQLRLAGNQFFQLCHADLHDRRLFKMQESFAQAEIETVADSAVQTFLARYGTGR